MHSNEPFIDRVNPAEIGRVLEPVGQHLRELAEIYGGHSHDSDISLQIEQFSGRIEQMAREPQFDYELAHHLRALARQMDESPLKELVVPDISLVSELASHYQNHAAFNKGI